MKLMTNILRSSLSLAAAGVLACVCSCSKQDQPSTESPATGLDATTVSNNAVAPASPKATTATSIVESARDQAAVAQSSALQATQRTAGQVQSATDAAAGQAQTLLDQAKSFVAEKKYEQALSTLKQTANLKLTPEQQKVLEDLQRQVQSGLAALGVTNAASKLNSLLGGKK